MEIKGALTLPHHDLLKKRRNILRTSHKGVMNFGRKLLGYNEDVKNIFFTKAEIDEAQVASWSLIPPCRTQKEA